MGDVNVDYIKYDTCSYAQNLFNTMSQHGFIPVISRPTRIGDHKMSLIDHIYTNSFPNLQSSGIITNHFADHLGPYIKLFFGPTKKYIPPTTYEYINFSEENMHKVGYLQLKKTKIELISSNGCILMSDKKIPEETLNIFLN